MSDQMTDRELADEVWYWYLNGRNKAGFPKEFVRRLAAMQHAFHLLPGTSRCLQCEVPLAGAGGWVMKAFGYHPSVLTPRLCNGCEKMILATEGGAEVEISLLFADIRGSTSMAAQTGAMEYKDFIQRFYKTAAKILIEHNALVNRLVGDQVIGLFAPRFVGPKHAAAAIEAAQEILRATGHTDPGGPWAPVGIGVHVDSAYVGAVGTKDGVNEIAVLGNAANLTARLSSKAAKGEVLISEQTAIAANLTDPALEKRRLKLKGLSKTVPVRVITVSPAETSAVSSESAVRQGIGKEGAS